MDRGVSIPVHPATTPTMLLLLVSSSAIDFGSCRLLQNCSSAAISSTSSSCGNNMCLYASEIPAPSSCSSGSGVYDTCSIDYQFSCGMSYGRCADGVTMAQGPNGEGCPVSGLQGANTACVTYYTSNVSGIHSLLKCRLIIFDFRTAREIPPRTHLQTVRQVFASTSMKRADPA